jgi:hypothetical protein
MKRPVRHIVRSVLILVFGIAVFAQGDGPVLPDPGSPHMSHDQQVQLGLRAAAQVYQQMPVLPDSSPETQYIRTLGTRLAATIPPDRSWPWDFHVVAQKDVNAFAVPGGEMFVNIGTIEAAANEAQLAGVMAHEMSHVYMQHSAKQQDKAQWTEGLAGLAGAILGSRGGMIGELGQMGTQLGAGMLMLKYSRGDEAQADAVGAMILYKAGYDPRALAQFFETLEAQGNNPPQFLSDHPNPGNRREAIQNEVANWPQKSYQRDSPEFARIRKHADSVPSYTAQQIAEGQKANRWESFNRSNGAVFTPPAGVPMPASVQQSSGAQNSGPVSWSQVAPSDRFELSDLGFVRMVHPDNWDVAVPQQSGKSIVIAPRAGVSGDGISYGVVINRAAPSRRGASIDDITEDLVSNFESGQSGMRRMGTARRISVAGASGRVVDLQSTSPAPDAQGQPQNERDRLVTIPQQDGSAIFLVLVAPEQDFEKLRPAFERMLKSVSF